MKAMQREVIVGTVSLTAKSSIPSYCTFFLGRDVTLLVDGVAMPFERLDLHISRDALVQLYVDDYIVQPNGKFVVDMGSKCAFTFPERPGAFAGQDCLAYPQGIGGGELSTLSIHVERDGFVRVRTEATAQP